MKYIIILFSFFLFFLPESADALRCGSRLVSKGDRKVEVFQKCGEPVLIEEWTEETVFVKRSKKKFFDNANQKGRGKIVSKSRTSFVEEWTYNFGANRFIYYLTFVNGRLRKINSGSRGYNGDIPINADKTRCGSIVSVGDRKIEVLQKCGEPFAIDAWEEKQMTTLFDKGRISTKDERDGNKAENKSDTREKIIINKNYKELQRYVNVEEWTYNFGPHYFLNFIRFENGRVVEVERGDHGFL